MTVPFVQTLIATSHEINMMITVSSTTSWGFRVLEQQLKQFVSKSINQLGENFMNQLCPVGSGHEYLQNPHPFHHFEQASKAPKWSRPSGSALASHRALINTGNAFSAALWSGVRPCCPWKFTVAPDKFCIGFCSKCPHFTTNWLSYSFSSQISNLSRLPFHPTMTSVLGTSSNKVQRFFLRHIFVGWSFQQIWIHLWSPGHLRFHLFPSWWPGQVALSGALGWTQSYQKHWCLDACPTPTLMWVSECNHYAPNFERNIYNNAFLQVLHQQHYLGV